MSIWRIRITLPGDPGSHALLNEALAGQPVSQVRLMPRAADTAELTGDVVLELNHDDGLGALLSALHTISPQVFVARADPVNAAPAQPEAPVSRRALRVRRLNLLRAGAAQRLGHPAGPARLTSWTSQLLPSGSPKEKNEP
jgi:hypothetical protein